MATQEQVEIFQTCLNLGCCLRCSLRYTGIITADFHDPVSYIVEAKLDVNPKGNEENEPKRLKPNPCIVCLNLLHETTLDSMLQSPGLSVVSKYDAESFVNYISFPVSILLREHSMTLHMKEHFEKFYDDHIIFALNKAWTLSVQDKLAKTLGKKHNKNGAPLILQFIVDYEHEKEEIGVMSKLGKTPPKYWSRNYVVELLKSLEDKIFKKHVVIPPEAPKKAVELTDVTCQHDAIYVAGRYNKYSRNLGQTPWFIDDVRVVDNSVQEIIFGALEPPFNESKGMVFSSSGREDVDVRTLGRGRPFFIKILDSKITRLDSEIFRKAEEDIEKTGLVKVRDLQFIDKKDLCKIKEGEEEKRKSYKALCIIDKPERLEEYLEKINSLTSVKLQQKTPIRVYHRRSPSTRSKEIYSINARKIEGRDNMFELDLETQAGTYVKEFVHGDLGRTQPNLAKIIGGHVDILALDVLDIQLDFPPSLSS